MKAHVTCITKKGMERQRAIRADRPLSLGISHVVDVESSVELLTHSEWLKGERTSVS